MAQFSRSTIPPAYNEVMRDYPAGSEEAIKLKAACDKMRNECPEIPCVVGGKEIKTGDVKKQLIPSDNKHVLATFHQANSSVLQQAVDAALAAKTKWEEMPFDDRAAIFLKAADLLSKKYKYEILAATMLGQGKTVWQAEIDACAEVVDFWRFNVQYAQKIYEMQPDKHSQTVWNKVEYRPLEGYVVAISPFNFTAIGANLPSSPALMGNVILWKPASTAMLSNWILFKILREAGLPDGVINFLPGSGALIGDTLLNSKYFAGLHFTGSTGVFNGILHKTATHTVNNLYLGYPRIVGETGGKDFHFCHTSADVDNFVNCTIRGAFEYQGQKCSACSRVYVPDTLWPEIEKKMVDILKQVKMGQADDFSCFMSAVIDKNSFENIKSYIQYAKDHPNEARIAFGGQCDDSKGYFVTPTLVVTTNPHFKLIEEEIFGPVLTVYVYPADKYEESLELCNKTSPYALTGAIFARDRYAIDLANKKLRHAAGNFYINDKCTGAVVGQQPFGGGRASGTNDKAGSLLNLLRWVSARTVKESFAPYYSWDYPHMRGVQTTQSGEGDENAAKKRKL